MSHQQLYKIKTTIVHKTQKQDIRRKGFEERETIEGAERVKTKNRESKTDR